MPDRVDIVYDGECRFCTRVLNALRALDRDGALHLHDSHDVAAVTARFPELAGADFVNAMFAVSPAGITRGYFAFKQIVRHVPLAWPVLPLFYVPGADVVGPKIYAWVARHRSSFGCAVDVVKTPPDAKT